jgi:hypothetical protein
MYPGERIRQRIRSDPVGSNQPAKSDQIPGFGMTFGSLMLEFDGTQRWVLTDLYY